MTITNMYDLALRQIKERALKPVCSVVPAWIAPTHVTFIGFVAGIASCYAATVAASRPYALALWILNRVFDSLDGSLARFRGVATETGGFLDLLGDFIVYSLIPISVAISQSRHSSVQWTAIALLEASFHINNFVLLYIATVDAKGLRSVPELTSLSMQPALVEGLESAIFFTLMLLLPSFINLLSWVMCAAVVIGIVQRTASLVPVLKQLDRSKLDAREDKVD
jgi:phosphatidylglycerophosphate synthase